MNKMKAFYNMYYVVLQKTILLNVHNAQHHKYTSSKKKKIMF